MPKVTLRLQAANQGGVDGYSITLEGAAAPAPADFVPAAGLETAKFTRAILAARLQTPDANIGDFPEIGDHLCGLIFRPAIETAWQNLQQPIQAQLSVPPDLADLPWELLRHDSQFLFLTPLNPICRRHPAKIAFGIQPREGCTWPLRVLLIIGAQDAPPKSLGDIEAGPEISAVEQELLRVGHSIDLEILYRPTADALRDKVRIFRPQIIHFIGHGETDAADGPCLRFQLGGAQSWNWKAAEIPYLFVGLKDYLPRFVFLNACRTAIAPTAGATNRSVAGAFLSVGVPAVLAMQADIRGDMAGRFAAGIYRNIAAGCTIDQAIAQSRLEMGSPAQGHWAIPVLSVSKDDPAEVFTCRPQVADDVLSRIYGAFDDVQLFANRKEKYREMREKLYPSQPTTSIASLVVVTGDAEQGKSHLVKWFLEGLAVWNSAVHYVEITESVSFLDFLLNIKNSSLTADLRMLPVEAFHRFHFELKNLIETGMAGQWKGEAVSEPAIQLDATNLKSDQILQEIGRSFRSCLADLAKARQLVLVLDQFCDASGGTVPQPDLFLDKGAIREHFLLPIQRGEIPGLYVILVMRERQLGDFKIQQLVPAKDWVRIPKFPGGTFSRAAREMLWFQESRWPGLNLIIQGLDAGSQADWGANTLKVFSTIVKLNCINPALTEVVGRMR